MINGVLTTSAIIFGLSTFQIGKRKLRHHVILYIILFLQTLSIYVVGLSYFMDFVHYKDSTFRTFMFATSSLLINTFNWAIVRMFREL